MAHPRAKLTVAGRRLLVERVLEQGWPVVRAAEAQDVSAATAYKWVRRWRAEGLAGLADRGCRPTASGRSWPTGPAAGWAAPDRLGAGRGPLYGLRGAAPPPGAPAVGAGPAERAGGALPASAAWGAALPTN
jgi:leucine-zipper of insertion element IS481